jgi:hypothetical protein
VYGSLDFGEVYDATRERAATHREERSPGAGGDRISRSV